ncbi:carboxylesterase [Penicillium lagena]|uniref:carboxylesterase n=1 Tax=Penicillium lagena TaxID=94218 RepID=UPI0025413E9B|nr:carboxylesterase [Penicillium lagena]KAJ5618937.1 carboxylesterase [Penicillium lagena]
MTFSVLRAGVVFAAAVQVAADPSLTVRTETGIFTGLQNNDFTGVREFRNIPFAQPPVGSLRFQPPQRLPPSNQHRYSTRFPPSCPQFISSGESFWNLFVPYLLPPNGNQNHSSGLSLQTASEDCLSLAIWTPYDAPANAKLPVAFFMTGGGFQSNGVDVPGQIPAPWVNRSQEHIVVTINYRLNIFGFPNARALDSPNLAILDQRLALEWVHENIAAFGGDPESIMMWGQSAGAMSTDIHNYAFWENPIVHGSFSQSGTALAPVFSSDFSHSSFTTVAKNLGCDFPDNPTAELECMQQVPVDLIENFIGQYDGPASLSFEPIPDEKVVFSDYPARAAAGKISPRPAIFSDAANEYASLYTWPSSNASAGPFQPFVDAETLGAFICPNAKTSILRKNANVTTYRYQFAGVWPNQNPYSWLGAYHSSDLMMNFGTYFYDRTNSTTGPTALEIKTSEAMQDHILAFMKDPEDGPPAIGWNPYTYGGSVLRFGANGVPVQNASGYAIDGPCYGEGTYDPFP